MTITYAPCNTCGTKLVKHQAALTNANVEGFECPTLLEERKQSQNLDNWQKVLDAQEEGRLEGWDTVDNTVWDGEVEVTVVDDGRKVEQLALGDFFKRVHQAASKREAN